MSIVCVPKPTEIDDEVSNIFSSRPNWLIIAWPANSFRASVSMDNCLHCAHAKQTQPKMAKAATHRRQDRCRKIETSSREWPNSERVESIVDESHLRCTIIASLTLKCCESIEIVNYRNRTHHFYAALAADFFCFLFMNDSIKISIYRVSASCLQFIVLAPQIERCQRRQYPKYSLHFNEARRKYKKANWKIISTILFYFVIFDAAGYWGIMKWKWAKMIANKMKKFFGNIWNRVHRTGNKSSRFARLTGEPINKLLELEKMWIFAKNWKYFRATSGENERKGEPKIKSMPTNGKYTSKSNNVLKWILCEIPHFNQNNSKFEQLVFMFIAFNCKERRERA